MTHTPTPWQHVSGIDTHQVKRDRQGRMLGPVTMDLVDYDHACACVNGCAGLNPDGYHAVVTALASLVEFAHAALADTIHADTLAYYEQLAHAALDHAKQTADA